MSLHADVARRSSIRRRRPINKRLIVVLVSLSALFAGTTSIASASASTSGPTGYSSSAADWWQWILQQPKVTNPLTDTSGARCGIGQHGQPWFLAGAPESGKPVTRHCIIPVTKPLFFPVVNAFSCAVASDPQNQHTVAYQRSVVAHVKNDARDLSVWVDGKKLPSSALTFTRSNVFAVNLPPGNLFGVPQGVCRPGVDSGYYVQLPAFRAGQHTLRWHGVLKGPDQASSTTQDVTYHLRVYPPLGG